MTHLRDEERSVLARRRELDLIASHAERRADAVALAQQNALPTEPTITSQLEAMNRLLVDADKRLDDQMAVADAVAARAAEMDLKMVELDKREEAARVQESKLLDRRRALLEEERRLDEARDTLERREEGIQAWHKSLEAQDMDIAQKRTILQRQLAILMQDEQALGVVGGTAAEAQPSIDREE